MLKSRLLRLLCIVFQCNLPPQYVYQNQRNTEREQFESGVAEGWKCKCFRTVLAYFPVSNYLASPKALSLDFCIFVLFIFVHFKCLNALFFQFRPQTLKQFCESNEYVIYIISISICLESLWIIANHFVWNTVLMVVIERIYISYGYPIN